MRWITFTGLFTAVLAGCGGDPATRVDTRPVCRVNNSTHLEITIFDQSTGDRVCDAEAVAELGDSIEVLSAISACGDSSQCCTFHGFLAGGNGTARIVVSRPGYEDLLIESISIDTPSTCDVVPSPFVTDVFMKPVLPAL
jgi:hypothetical protein